MIFVEISEKGIVWNIEQSIDETTEWLWYYCCWKEMRVLHAGLFKCRVDNRAVAASISPGWHRFPVLLCHEVPVDGL